MKPRSGGGGLTPPAVAEFCPHPLSRRQPRGPACYLCSACCRFISGPLDALIAPSLPGPERERLARWYGLR